MTTLDYIDFLFKITNKNEIDIISESNYHVIKFNRANPRSLAVEVNRYFFIFNKYYLYIDENKYKVNRQEYRTVRDKIKRLAY